jgi:hypothetical protein
VFGPSSHGLVEMGDLFGKLFKTLNRSHVEVVEIIEGRVSFELGDLYDGALSGGTVPYNNFELLGGQRIDGESLVI